MTETIDGSATIAWAAVWPVAASPQPASSCDELDLVASHLGAVLDRDLDAVVAVIAEERGVARDRQRARDADRVTIGDLDASDCVCVAHGGRVLGRRLAGRRLAARRLLAGVAAIGATRREGEHEHDENRAQSHELLHPFFFLQWVARGTARAMTRLNKCAAS